MSLYSSTLDLSEEAGSFLERLPLFSCLSQDQLAEIADRMRQRTFAPGVILFHQDMPGMMLYLIEDGWIRAFSIGRTGQELTLDVFGPGDLFGVLSSLDNNYHSATAITLTRTVVWMISRTDLEAILEQYPPVTKALLGILVKRMRAYINHAEAMTFQDVQGRLAYEILSLAERHGHAQGDAIDIRIPLTQGDLATMVGATRESVNKALMALRAQSLVTMDGTQLSVCNSSGLRNVVFERGR
ncbi:MAG TPA: Crp/Fnr family transcriptional regulator [Anaerolineales bacterium]|nr:Crp/Fnr family transcriptional regulator [Anaerolineales bacterium]